MFNIQKKSLKVMLVLALAVSVLVPLINVYGVFPYVTKSVIEQAEADSVQLGRHISMMMLDGRNVLSTQQVERWAAEEHESILADFELMKMRVFSSTGEIIFSSKVEEIGNLNKKSYFHEIVAKGTVFSKSVVKEQKSQEGEVFHKDVVETYVPIVRGNEFLGALEIYQDITQVHDRLDKVLYLAVGVPLSVMLVFMVGFCVGVIRVDRYMQLQQETEDKLNEDKKKQQILFEKVEQAKKEWESTMDCIEDMVMLTDTEFTITRCNRSVLSFTGLDYSEILKKRFVDIFPMDEEDDQGECFDKSFEYYHKPTGSWLFLSVYPVKNKDNQVVALVCTAHNFTEVKNVSIALQEKNIEIDQNREKLENALDSISSLISKVVNEQTFDVAFENPTLKRCYEVKQCGHEECPCYGKEPTRCWQEQGTFCIGGLASTDKEKRECLKCKHYLETIDDPIYQIGEQFNNMMYILAAKNNEVEEAYGELKATQGQLLQQEKMASIGQLAAGVAHEINNPMGFIGSNISTLDKYVSKLQEFIEIQENSLNKFVSDAEALASVKESRKQLKLDFVLEDIKDLVEESLDGCDRVKKIVMDLKGFSRVDQADHQKIDINECMESTLNIVRNELKYKATIEKEYGQIDAIECYPQQLNQVFMNILVNAAHAIEKEGIITIKTWQDDDFVYSSISDNGSGMPKETVDRIFEPFFTTKDVGKGTGLGLSIVYDIIAKNHNGDIEVESTEGKGTCFTVKIPFKG